MCEPTVLADVYGYVDKDGDYHFTDHPKDGRYKLWIKDQGSESAEMNAKLSDPHIRKASQKFGVDPALIKAVIRVESNFNPRAVSPVGALGIMQLMPDTASRMGVVNIFDAEDNIYGGTQYLKELMTAFGGNLLLSLAAYNIGEKTVKKYRGVPPVRQTQDFVKRVLQWYQAYRLRDGKAPMRRAPEDLRI